MKKIIMIAAIAGVSLASCKKDRVCACTETKTTTNGSVSVTQTSNVDVTYKNETKRISNLSCVHTKSTDTNPNFTVVRESNCVLK